MNLTNFIITKINGEIESLEIELNHIHNSDSISPNKKYNKIKKILLKISEYKNILGLYMNYIIESKQLHDDNNTD